MKINDKEFHELMGQFEKDAKELFFGHRIEKESKDTIAKYKIFYQDGFVDSMFKAYMSGYSFCKCVNG